MKTDEATRLLLLYTEKPISQLCDEGLVVNIPEMDADSYRFEATELGLRMLCYHWSLEGDEP